MVSRKVSTVVCSAEPAVAEPATAGAKEGVARMSFQRGSVHKVKIGSGGQKHGN